MLYEIVDAYLAAALWTTDPDPGCGEYQPDFSRVSPALWAYAEDAVREFLAAVAAAGGDLEGEDPGQLGHDLWLTRNGHGAGFWDGGWPEPLAGILTRCARAMGEDWETERELADAFEGGDDA